MSKAVLISIRPEWVNRIISGEKTVEIRKNRPNLETPFKVYIYCTDGFGKNTVNIPITQEQLWQHYAETGSMECLNCPIGNQKVIGEFVCNDILKIDKRGMVEENFDYCYASLREWGNDDIAIYIEAVRKSCVPREQLNQYGENVHFLYLWKISKLKIYETPKELTEFHTWKKCKSCSKSGYESTACAYDENCMVPEVITKAPQRWCYVEELNNGLLLTP